jgi:2-iminobutanoate/2-iminopropanoate deaminase
MTPEVIHTDKAPEAVGPYSQAVAAGPYVFFSGQIGLDPETGNLVNPDFELQTRQALENLREVVLAANCQMSHVVAVDVFLSNIGNFSRFNEIYAEFFPTLQPARAVVEVSRLPKGSCIEIKAVAFRG